MIQSDQLRHLIHFEVLKRKGVLEEKVESNGCFADRNEAKESEGVWFSFHCVMDLEAISSTYPQSIDFCVVFLTRTMARSATSEEELCRVVTPSVASFIMQHHLYSFHSES